MPVRVGTDDKEIGGGDVLAQFLQTKNERLLVEKKNVDKTEVPCNCRKSNISQKNGCMEK